MRIAIDARLNAYRRGGIPQYTRQLLTALAALERNETFLSLQHRDQLRPLVVAPNVRRRTLFTPPHHRLEQWSLPLELLLIRPDLLHCPDFIVPRHRSCPAVVTVHDLAFMHYPEILDDAARHYYSQVRESVHSAEAVIAVSQATRDDIVSLLDLPPERVDVVYEAASPSFTPLDLASGATRTIGAHTLRADSFALFVSTLEPRKNLPTLLKALRVCIDRRPGTVYRLVVAGARGWRYKPIFETVRDLGLEDAVLFLDSVGDDDLRWLYSACVCYANPSLYEGFALTPLEALACGAATLVSATSSLPEVVGDAALLLPPLDVAAWADALELIWHDGARRADLAARGPARANMFSWQRAARQTMDVYRNAMTRRGALRASAPVRMQSTVAPLLPAEAPPSLVVPEPPAERSVAPAPPVTEDSSAPVVSPVARLCLRCGAPLEAGMLIDNVGWRADGSAQVAHPKHLQAWACSVCGMVELVLAPPTATPTNGQAVSMSQVDGVALTPHEIAPPIETANALSPVAPEHVEQAPTSNTTDAPSSPVVAVDDEVLPSSEH